MKPSVSVCMKLTSAPLVVRHKGKPSRVHWRGLAEQMGLSEKTADAAVDE
jgi:hypothetical protein